MKWNQPWMMLATAALATPLLVACSHDDNTGGPDPLTTRQPAPPTHSDMSMPPTASPGNPLYGTKPTPPPEVTTPGVTPQQTQTPPTAAGTGMGTNSNGSALSQRRLQDSPPPSTQPTGNISVGPGAATDTGGTVVTPRSTPVTPEQQLQQQNR